MAQGLGSREQARLQHFIFFSPSHRRSSLTPQQLRSHNPSSFAQLRTTPTANYANCAQPLRPCACTCAPAPLRLHLCPCAPAPAPVPLRACAPSRLRPCANCAQPPSANRAQPHLAHLRSPSPSLSQPPRTGRK
ncbi:hypothetical protein ACOSQ3_013437 [Xanthoceras sorbifolium]